MSKLLGFAFLAMGVLGLCDEPTLAQQSSAGTLEGTWQGTLKPAPGVDLRIVFNVKAEGGLLNATMDSPDQAAKGIKVDSVAHEKETVTFTLKMLNGKFTGKLNAKGDEIVGEWNQGVALPLTLKKVEKGAITAVGAKAPKELEGLWLGKLTAAGGIEIRLVLRVEKPKDGADHNALLDSPDQGAKGIGITSIDLKDGVLTWESKPVNAKFRGKADPAGTEYSGDFTQNGATIPLTLKKTDKIAELRRPQEPKPPFPYLAEEVEYQNEAASIKLAGTLTKPKGDGPFPVVLLITGSGPQDRDESLLGHKPFLVLADYLTRRGIAVLRVDDRGIGGSSGNILQSTSDDFAGDTLAGVNYLKTRKDIDPARIGLLGHSEGGIIAPIAAARSKDVAFIVLLAGTGLPGDEILEMQRRLILKVTGASDEKVKLQNDLSRKLIAATLDADTKQSKERIEAVIKEIMSSLSDADKKELGEGSSIIDAQVKQLQTPWFRYFLTYDPRPALAKVSCPVLAVNGENDLQVPPKENLAEIAKALHSAGNSKLTTHEFKGLNHLFQNSKTGSPSEYGTIEETMAPEALQFIGDWITTITKVKTTP